MKRTVLLTTLLLLLVVATLAAHDLFLKPTRFFVMPNSEVVLRVLNGSFTSSENAVSRDRVVDISVISAGGREHLDTTAWTARGDTSLLTLRTRGEGSYVVGASTRPRVLRLEAKAFNAYLAEDGLPDVLTDRRRRGESNRAARERYSKHVKTLLQVGEARSEGVSAVLGYPAELVPLDNPYALRVGDTMRVRALVDGVPVPNQVVLMGGKASSRGTVRERLVRTDADGVARLALSAPGEWYVKFIRMVRVAEDSVDYESKWATLTFAMR